MSIPFLPPFAKESLDAYFHDRRPVGNFLHAVLCNDLFGAIGRADDINARHLREICQYVYCYIPSICWGSPEKVKKWLDRSAGE